MYIFNREQVQKYTAKTIKTLDLENNSRKVRVAKRAVVYLQ